MKTEDYKVGSIVEATDGWVLRRDPYGLRILFGLMAPRTTDMIIDKGTRFVIEDIRPGVHSSIMGQPCRPTIALLSRLRSDGTYAPSNSKYETELDDEWTNKSMVGLKTPIVGQMKLAAV